MDDIDSYNYTIATTIMELITLITPCTRTWGNFYLILRPTCTMYTTFPTFSHNEATFLMCNDHRIEDNGAAWGQG